MVSFNLLNTSPTYLDFQGIDILEPSRLLKQRKVYTKRFKNYSDI